MTKRPSEGAGSASGSHKKLKFSSSRSSLGPPASFKSLAAWSKHNLVARVCPATITAPARLSVSLLRQPKSSKTTLEPQPKQGETLLTLQKDEEAHQLSFSPCGSHLVLAVGRPNRVRLVLFALDDTGCLDHWRLAHEWALDCSQQAGAAVVAIEWLSHDREVLYCCSLHFRVTLTTYARLSRFILKAIACAEESSQPRAFAQQVGWLSLRF